MKRTPFTPQWFIVSLLIILTLSACVRPVPRDDVTDTPDTTEPTTDPIVVPTLPPTDSIIPEPTAAPDTAVPDDAGPDTPAVEPTAVPLPLSEPTAVPADTTHTVRAGDTLSGLAQQYGVSIEEIAAANNMTDIDTLDVGQLLTIPVPGATPATPPQTGERTHLVKAGENLFRIGLAYGFTAEELAAYNGIPNPARIEAGQVLRIPPGD